jgi:hypothetical protein
MMASGVFSAEARANVPVPDEKLLVAELGGQTSRTRIIAKLEIDRLTSVALWTCQDYILAYANSF